MTLLQIRYVVYAADCLSINKAASLLYTTPSNVSKSIKSLEDELGYSIFIRTANGLLLTSVGAKFIQYASSILEDCEKLATLAQEKSYNTFSICYNQVPFIRKAFNTFCSQPEISSLKLKLYQGNYWYCLEQLKKNKCQIAFLSFFASGATAYLKEMQDAGMETVLISEANAALVMRTGHPLLEEATLAALPLDRLTDYPYVNFTMPGYEREILSPYQIGGDRWKVNPDRLIDVNSTDQKLQLIKNTNAYTFVSTSADVITVSGGYVVIPDTQSKFHYYYAFHQKEPVDEIGKLFLKCFRQELDNKDNILE